MSCGWLFLEDAVIVKFNATATATLALGFFQWSLVLTGPTRSFTIRRDARNGVNRWTFALAIDGCITVPIFPQPEDEQLADSFEITDGTFFGACVTNPPVGKLIFKSYATQAAAKVDYPDLLEWAF